MSDINFRSIFNALPIPNLLLRADQDFTIVEVNPAYLAATQCQRENLVNVPLFIAFPENPDEIGGTGVSNLRASLEKVIATGTKNDMAIQKYDIPIRGTSDFEVRYWSPSNAPVIENGKVVFILHSATDVTAEVLAAQHEEQEIKTSREQYEVVAKATNDIIWDWDVATGRVRRNDAVESLLGYANNREISHTDWWRSKLHPEDAAGIEESLNSVINEDGNNWSGEYRYQCADGSYKYFLDRAFLIRNEDGKLLNMIGSMLDITERKRIEEELILAKEHAIESNMAKSQFLSMMSHEIRTPLNAVIGISHLLLMDEPKPDQIENLNALKFSSENLLVLINDILDFSKIEAGKIEFEHTDFSIVELINNICMAQSYKAEEKGIDVRINIGKELSGPVVGDPVRLGQILTNLISNAVKFTELGIITVEATQVAESRDSSTIFFAVTDTGVGMAPESLHTIFDSFTQASSDTTRRFGGTGLGLAITKRLLELQGSQVFVESSLGKGSKFHFTLTLKKSTHQFSEQPAIDTVKDKNGSLKGRRILVVEDNLINIMVARQFLQRWGVEVDTALNGFEGIEKVSTKDYDVVLMDLQMPEMDGYEATIHIRKLQGTKFQQLPIIALTASAMLDIKDKAFDVGMNDYISKPFNPNELYSKITKYSGVSNR